MNFKSQPTIGLLRAIIFATEKHGDQKRKYTGEPYMVHPLEVAKNLAFHNIGEPCLIGAILHDTIEDTGATHKEIEDKFGTVIADIVQELTDPPLSFGNREKRKEFVREKMKGASWYAKTIKYADIIDNLHSIVQHDKNFGKVFVQEVFDSYEVLSGGDEKLYAELKIAIEMAKDKIGEEK